MSTAQTISKNLLPLIGRALLSLLFIVAGLSKIVNLEGTEAYIGSVGLPLASVLTILTIVVELGAGLALLLGYFTRSAALVLALFTIAASVLFHAFWAVPVDQQFVTQLLFFKNIAIVGGLLVLASVGAETWSLDARLRHSSAE